MHNLKVHKSQFLFIITNLKRIGHKNQAKLTALERCDVAWSLLSSVPLESRWRAVRGSHPLASTHA